ncbi:MAG: type II 3-dehydroquinate dehydratase [Robiginitomaculum sp.]|nr:MAG: type II 3-dehydroquinate dehydratase [Robiginitomaculum sp.]
MTKTIYILNGPNLNLLGQREPEIYGSQTLGDVQSLCKTACESNGYTLEFLQTNIEGELVNHIQEARTKACGLIINPAAYTHTSIALYDALKTLTIPIIEVHISQPAARESFRQVSYVAQAATGTISGLGVNSYLLAITAVINKLDNA